MIDKPFDSDHQYTAERLLKEKQYDAANQINLMDKLGVTENRIPLSLAELSTFRKLERFVDGHELVTRIRLPLTRGES